MTVLEDYKTPIPPRDLARFGLHPFVRRSFFCVVFSRFGDMEVALDV